MRLLWSGLRKLVRRPATWVTLGLLLGLMTLVFVAVGATANQAPAPSRAMSLLLLTFPGAYGFILSFILGLGGLFALLYGAAIAGSEWTWGTFKSVVARGESRSRYLLATVGAVGVMSGMGLLVALGVGVVVALLGATLAGVSTAGVSDSEALRQVPEQLARGWLAIVEQGALGFAIATVARSQIAGIGLGIGVYFGEQFASIFLPDIVQYLPFHAASAVVEVSGGSSGMGNGIVQSLDPTEALIAVAAWLAVALTITVTFGERAEITG